MTACLTHLKFPSAIETPYPENNAVWGRFFEAKIRDLALVVLPQWNCQWDGHVSLCSVLQRAGISSPAKPAQGLASAAGHHAAGRA